MIGGSPRRLLGRTLGLFALLLLIPALGFGWMGWRSVEREHQFRLDSLAQRARSAVARRVDEVVIDLERLRQRESLRPWYEWKSVYVPGSLTYETVAFQRNTLADKATDPRIRGRFEWERGPRGVHRVPRVLRGDQDGDGASEALARALEAEHGDRLRRMLDEATPLGRGQGWTQRTHPLWLVAANEESGQLLEEQAHAQRLGEIDVPYIENFRRRVAEGFVEIDYGPFRYIVGEPDGEGPPLIAVRLVHIPATHATRREVRTARWLLQGYALDPRAAFPDGWTSAGGIEMVRADAAPLDDLRGAARGDLARRLGASTNDGSFRMRLHPGLVLLARPDRAEAESARQGSRGRFLWLGFGLFTLVAVGFGLLWREVRREVELARRKEDFIAAITHELKTPLTGIRMYADMLKAGWVASPDAAEGYATRILDETGRLGHLVDQVLDLAALERGVARVNAQPGDLGAAVVDAAGLMQPKAAEAGLELVTDVAEELPEVTFDPRLVRPLILNLLDNAIKYGARGTTKEVGVRVATEGERVVVTVFDHGDGIPPALRKKIFEPFQRAGGELTRDAPGVGIGLALVKRYAEAHNARIVVESEVGKGTQVSVRFRVG